LDDEGKIWGAPDLKERSFFAHFFLPLPEVRLLVAGRIRENADFAMTFCVSRFSKLESTLAGP
jgi:hypothetical protein